MYFIVIVFLYRMYNIIIVNVILLIVLYVFISVHAHTKVRTYVRMCIIYLLMRLYSQSIV